MNYALPSILARQRIADVRCHAPGRLHEEGARRVFLSNTADLGKPEEPGSFVAAAVAAVLRMAGRADPGPSALWHGHPLPD